MKKFTLTPLLVLFVLVACDPGATATVGPEEKSDLSELVALLSQPLELADIPMIRRAMDSPDLPYRIEMVGILSKGEEKEFVHLTTTSVKFQQTLAMDGKDPARCRLPVGTAITEQQLKDYFDCHKTASADDEGCPEFHEKYITRVIGETNDGDDIIVVVAIEVHCELDENENPGGMH